MAELSYAQVSALLKYDSDTGKLFWKERDPSLFKGDAYGGQKGAAKWWNNRYAGKEAFINIDVRGYLNGAIHHRTVRAHRVAWLLHYGVWPSDQIDHINGNRTDNRAQNLRVATNAENSRNQKRHSNNTSGVSGVSWHKPRGKWAAAIRVDGRNKFLGYFDNIDEAAEARSKANAKHGYSERHGVPT